MAGSGPLNPYVYSDDYVADMEEWATEDMVPCVCGHHYASAPPCYEEGCSCQGDVEVFAHVEGPHPADGCPHPDHEQRCDFKRDWWWEGPREPVHLCRCGWLLSRRDLIGLNGHLRSEDHRRGLATLGLDDYPWTPPPHAAAGS